jgi:hypothetical protein
MSRGLHRLIAACGAVAALASSASACPSCSVGQGLETLGYVLGFLLIPYAVVMGVLYWMRRLYAEERGF